MDYSTIIAAVLGAIVGGLLTAIVAALMQKQNEKESRLFNAKLEAYKEFVGHLESRFVSLTRKEKDLDILTLAEVSAKSLLVSSQSLNRELKYFLTYVSHVYKECFSPNFDEKKSDPMFRKLWDDAEKIEELMRKDLGF